MAPVCGPGCGSQQAVRAALAVIGKRIGRDRGPHERRRDHLQPEAEHAALVGRQSLRFFLGSEAFDLAEAYRTPVLVMTDGEVGHMREKIVLPSEDQVKLVERRPPEADPESYVPFRAVRGAVPDMATFGTGYHTYVTGLTHGESGLPATDDAAAHTELVERQCRKISGAVDALTRVEVDVEEGATVGILSYGISARSAAGAVRLLREQGAKVSLLRLLTVFPFPERVVRKFAEPLERLVVPELNLGQVCHVTRESLEGEAVVERVSKIGGEIITPDEIVRAVLEGGARVFTEFGFLRYFMNSSVVAVSAALFATLFASLAAYAFSFKNFILKEKLFALIIASMMVPG